MGDLLLGLAIMAALALLAFWLTAAVAQRLSWGQRNALGLLIVATLVLYARLLWQNTALASWLPYSNLVIVGNWFPIFLGSLAGVVSQMRGLPWFRRGAAIAVLAGFGAFAALLPLTGDAPRCGNHFTALGDCQQTTPYTCSAAAAATLLHLHGIAATEQEMAELCLTRHGTSWLGLYRGLKLKTQGTDWDVEVVRCSAEGVYDHAEWPMIMEVGLEADAPIDAAFRHEFGWTPGVRHSVVLLPSHERRLQIIDPSPSIGREDWDDESLRVLWRGHGLRLIKRS
jgi:hypothetical protein